MFVTRRATEAASRLLVRALLVTAGQKATPPRQPPDPTPTPPPAPDHGGFLRRIGYAVTRLLITKTDSGGRGFNFSEIVGNGAGAGVSNLYYPRSERTWTKTGQKWLTQVAVDGVFNIAKEFWPDIDHTHFPRPLQLPVGRHFLY
jgi:hypothetical protein